MPHQVALTVAAPVLGGHGNELQQLLQALGSRPDALPFEKLESLHFARLFVLEETRDLSGAPIPAVLILLSEVDSPADASLVSLVDALGGTLDEIFRHCVGYPTGDAPTREARLAFLRSRTIPVAAAYVNRVGRSARQIRQEAELRRAIEGFLDRSGGEWSGRSAVEIRSSIRDLVFADEALQWARKPAPKPELGWRIKEGLHAVLVPLVLILLLPLVLIGLVVWLVMLRLHERSE